MPRSYTRTILLSTLLLGAPVCVQPSSLVIAQQDVKNNFMNISEEQRAKKNTRLYKKAGSCAKKLILQFNDELQALSANVPGLLQDVIAVKAKLLQAYPTNSDTPYHSYAHTIGLALYIITQRISEVVYARKTFESLSLGLETAPYKKEIDRCHTVNAILGNLSCALSAIHTSITQCAEYKNEKTK